MRAEEQGHGDTPELQAGSKDPEHGAFTSRFALLHEIKESIEKKHRRWLAV